MKNLNEYAAQCLHALLAPNRSLFGRRAAGPSLGLELVELLRSAAPDPQLKFLHVSGIFRQFST